MSYVFDMLIQGQNIKRRIVDAVDERGPGRCEIASAKSGCRRNTVEEVLKALFCSVRHSVILRVRRPEKGGRGLVEDVAGVTVEHSGYRHISTGMASCLGHALEVQRVGR